MPALPPSNPRKGLALSLERRWFRASRNGYSERGMCPSLDVRDELTAQLLFQLHGLFENNVMSFITDNSRKWLLWQPGRRMGMTSQSKVPAVPPVCTKYLFSMGAPPHPLLGEEPWEEKGKRGAGGRTTQPIGRGHTRKLGPKTRGTPGIGCFSQTLNGKDHGQSIVPPWHLAHA